VIVSIQGRVLVVDDDPSIRSTLKEVLSRESHQVTTAESGEEALNLMRGTTFDLALLDLKMAGMDGLSLMKEIRRRSPATGIIMLTGYATLESAIGALRQGAHDYLLKPCEPEVLKNSIRDGLKKQWRDLRRKELDDSDYFESSTDDAMNGDRFLHVGDLLIDLRKHIMTMRGEPVSLTPTEFSVLVSLAESAGTVLRCEELVSRAQGYECPEQEARTIIKTHISHLRQKLEKDPSRPCHILNVRGVGYMLAAPVEQEV
jgi:two-component system alkaline phosphatase synthesis response regulator PhoP